MASEEPNLENLLQMGISAAKRGDKEGARVLFQQVLDGNKQNDRAWMWMAYVAPDKVERRRYLKTAIKINPRNKAAQKELKKMEKKRSREEQRTLMIGMGVALIALVGCVVIALAVWLT